MEYFMMFKFLGYRKKKSPSTRSEAFHKVYVQGTEVYTDRSTYTHGLSLSLTGNVNFFSSQFCTHFILPSEFRIS